MIAGITAQEFLLRKGYHFAGTCRCGGYFTEKYKKPPFEVKIRKTKYTFKVLEHNATLHWWQPLANLEKILNALDNKTI